MKRKLLLGIIACATFCGAVNLWIWKSVTPSVPGIPWEAALLCAAVDLLVVFCFIKRDSLLVLPKTLFQNKWIMWNLACNDFRSRFAGSYFGVFWAFVQPAITMLLYWFVFQVGIRAGAVSDYPFILYLMCGLIPWFYFQEAWSGGSYSLIEYNYLVKKVVFRIDILPAIKLISSIFVHLFFVVLVTVVCSLYGYYPSVYALQLLYYVLCNCVLLVGLSYMTSACAIFFRDITQIVNIALSIGVWVTPIMWNAAVSMPPVMQTLLKINPVYYIVDGFRDALLAKVWFWEKPIWTVWFWIFAILVYYFGTSVFYKLKPHFADML